MTRKAQQPASKTRKGSKGGKPASKPANKTRKPAAPKKSPQAANKKESPANAANNKVYAHIVNKLLARMEAGEAVWRKSWNYKAVGYALSNPLSGAKYSGQNLFLLAWSMMLEGWDSPFFATLKQVAEAGGRVVQGAVGTPIVTYTPILEEAGSAASRLGITAADVRPEDRETLFLRPRYYVVFNLKAQTTGLEDRIPSPLIVSKPFNPIESAEAIVQGYTNRPVQVWNAEDRAYYVPSEDIVSMPPKGSFDSEAEFYATLLHEYAHSTGHESRLGRKFGAKDTKEYAVEELVAEITAAILCGQAGIETKTLENSAAYLQHYHAVLGKDPDILFKAISLASAAADHILKVGAHAPAPVAASPAEVVESV